MKSAAQKELASADYWNKRYADERSGKQDEEGEDYEWFRTFEKLKPFLEKSLPSAEHAPKILQLGCGTSSLAADLYHVGLYDQVSIDFSSQAIEIMQNRHEDLQLDWRDMDVRHMTFADAIFDVAIDKGSLDVMLHCLLWDPEEDVKENVHAYVNEIARVQKPGGSWLYVTYIQPHFLKPLLARNDVWTVQVETLEDSPRSFEYFGFVLTKHST